jgi:hypothetical protein
MKLRLKLAWLIKGPFITAGLDPKVGLDSTFRRSSDGALSVSKHHVKGKVRAAARDVVDVFGIDPSHLLWWLGGAGSEPNEEGGNRTRSESWPESVFFSDLRAFEDSGGGPEGDWAPPWRNEVGDEETVLPRGLTTFPGDETYTRICRTAIESGRAKDQSLRSVEVQPRGQELWWCGQVEAWDSELSRLRAFRAVITAAAKSIEAFGADKGVGYGRVKSCLVVDEEGVSKELGEDLRLERVAGTVEAPPARRKAVSSPSLSIAPHSEMLWFDVDLVPLEPLFIGAVKRPLSNFIPCLEYIPGSVVRGALAAAMNRDAGQPVDTPIDDQNVAVCKAREPLSVQFTNLQASHMYISHQRADEWRRTIPVPISAFSKDKSVNQVWDAALVDPQKLRDGCLPSFRPDCDRLSSWVAEWGTAGIPLDGVDVPIQRDIRSAIDGRTYGPASAQLFANEQIAEGVRWGDNVRRTRFKGRIGVPGLEAQRDTIKQHVTELLKMARLGRSSSAVAARVTNACPAVRHEMKERLKQWGDRKIVLTLLSDTLLQLSGIDARTDMVQAYHEAWKKVGLPVRLERVFAQQALRNVGVPREPPYRSFLVTVAGSVFVLGVTGKDAAANEPLLTWLESLECSGVPVRLETWQTCPYIPQNGYGEVAVCHPWHRDRSPQ